MHSSRLMFLWPFIAMMLLPTSIAFSKDVGSASASGPRLVALDIVVLPGASVKQQADQANSILVSTFSDGFAFGDDYVPHVSLLQMFAEADQVSQIEDVIESVLKENKTSAKELALSSEGIQQGVSVPDSKPAIYAPKLTVAPSEGLSDLQDALVTALSPYKKTGGTEAAFLVNDADRAAAAKLGLPDILPLGIQLVDEYVAKESGSKFSPHITLGLADDAAWSKLSEQPFAAETADSPAVAVCLLGPYDSCHRIKGLFPLH